MGINVAGTNAIAGYLVSRIQNTRILMGEPAGYTSTPAVPAPASPTTSTSPSAPASALPTRAQLLQSVADAQLSNAQTLFGITQSGSDSSQPGSLPPIAGQTPHQIAMVAIQSSLVAQQFQNVSTLFSSLGIGAKLNSQG